MKLFSVSASPLFSPIHYLQSYEIHTYIHVLYASLAYDSVDICMLIFLAVWHCLFSEFSFPSFRSKRTRLELLHNKKSTSSSSSSGISFHRGRKEGSTTMSRIHQLVFIFSLIFTITSSISPSQGKADHNENSITSSSSSSSSPFSASLEALQKQINYSFQSVNVLRRAMTHPSFSEENNRALSILGLNLIETSISLRCLGKNIDISPKDLNNRITKISGMDSCTSEALRLGLQKIIRVSPKMNSSIPPVVCGAYRAIFGAIAIDTGKADDAGNVFWNVRRGREEEKEEGEEAFAL